MEKIGQTLLEQNINEENSVYSSSMYEGTDIDSSTDKSIYLNSLLLSKYLTEIKASREAPQISDKQRKQIASFVQILVNDLDMNSKGPSLNIGFGPFMDLYAYQVLAYALLVLENPGITSFNESNDQSKIQMIREKYKALKENHSELQQKYDSLLANSNDFDLNEKSSSYEAEKITNDSCTFELQSKVQQLEDQLKSAIKCRDKSDNLIQYLINRFNLPSNTSISNAITNIQNSNEIFQIVEENSQIEKLREENERLKLLLSQENSNESHEEISKIVDSERVTNASFQKQIEELAKELVAEREQTQALTIENNKQIIEIESLKQEKEFFDSKEKSNQQIISELNTQLSSLQKEMNEKSTNNESNDAKLFILETDLQVSKLKAKELQEDYNKKKEKNRNLQDIIQQLKGELKSQHLQYETLQMNHDKLQVDFEELKTNQKTTGLSIPSQNELSLKEAEIQNLHSALSELSEQIEITNADLATENESKNRLICLLQKQNTLLTEMEKNSRKTQKEANEKNARLLQIQDKMSSLQQQYEENKCDHSVIIKALSSFVQNQIEKGPFKDQISIILSENKDSTSRVVEMFEFILKKSNASVHTALSSNDKPNQNLESLEKQNQRLCIYISNLVHFMDQLVNSGDIQDWLLGDSQSQDFRSRLSAQVAHVESFLKTNSLISNEPQLCDSYAHFPSFLMKVLNDDGTLKLDEMQEYMTIIEQFSLSNDIITKFSEELQHRGTLLMNEMKSMRNELQKVDESIREQVDTATNELEEQLNEVQKEREMCMNKLKSIQKELRNSSGQSNSVLKCLGIINGDVEFPDDSDGEMGEQTIEEYVKALECALSHLSAEKEELLKSSDQKIAKIQKEFNDLEQEFDNYREETELKEDEDHSKMINLEDSFQNASQINQRLETELKNIREENDLLQQTLHDQTKHIEQFSHVREEEIAALKQEQEEKSMKELQELQVEIDKLSNMIENKEIETKEQIRVVKQNAKEEIKRIQNDLDLQIKRSNEIRGHYEPILSDLRSKLAEARQNETESKDSLLRVTADCKDIKSQLSSSRVDCKMLKMKLNAAEEKNKREKSLIETQIKMKILQQETDHQTSIEKIKAENNAANHAFLVSICEKFKDYVDFNQPICENSIIELLNKVSLVVQKSSQRMNDLEKFYSEINQIRTLLQIDSNCSLIQPISALVTKSNEFDKQKTKIEKDQNEVASLLKQTRSMARGVETSHEWEEWARRLHGIVTDSFSSAKNANELRFALEEALMNSIGQRHIWRRIDILRTEKAFLLSGMIRGPSRIATKPSMTTILAIIVSIRRLQKLAGHLKCSISLPKIEQSSPKKSAANYDQFASQKKWPILSSI